ncbi:MAG: WbqC family protein [Alphaproteobacteria bacterium]|nr:WbqC family protein [Alphaproteobacteria bacterium]
MKLAIMQPYFLPYIGYYQLIAAVDVFVVYDNIKYTKKGWINRNRMLLNGTDATFSLPLKKDSDYLDVIQREISPDFDRAKLLNQFEGAYRRAPYFAQTFSLLERIVRSEHSNLFHYIRSSIVETCAHLGIKTKICISSEVDIDHGLRGQDKVLAICKSLGARTYINAIGGLELYGPEEFKARGVELKFIKSKPLEYAQFGNEFVPWLSIVDVMMFNSLETVYDVASHNYELI